jgi:type II secretory pathway component PulM
MSLIAQFKTEWSNRQNFDSPIVIWGGLLSLGIILWALIIMPYLQWRDQQYQQFDQKIKKVSRLQALQEAADEWQQAQQQFQTAEEQMVASLFQQTSYVTAQTELLNILRKEIKNNSLKIESQRLQESETEKNIGQRISITLRLQGELINVLQLIHNLSQHSKLLNIEKLYINKSRQNKMAVSLQVSGFRLTADNTESEE